MVSDPVPFGEGTPRKSLFPTARGVFRAPARPTREDEGMRLNRYLAAAGLGSRRGCEELITARRVRINKRQAESPGERVPADANVTVDGREVRVAQSVVIALNKPRGVVCTATAQDRRPIIVNLMPRTFGRLFTVGRLDAESEGLILLTNQGDLAQRLAHPRNKVEKEYRVTLDRSPDEEVLRRLEKGVKLEEGMARAERIQFLGRREVRMVLRQGMKRQIRLMFRCLGFTVEKLKRVRIGGLELGHLPPGAWKVLSAHDARKLEVES
ncbi:MAG: pseudouridine synthase [Verrucomicrobia bacterium]|nr:pseudouridine synthase [Verrucomicrobiota bacterium]